MRDFQAISFYGRIQHSAVSEVNKFISLHSQRTPNVRVDFCMNSAGGEIARAFDLYNLLKSSPIELDMINMGHVSSCAIYPFLSVPLEQRYVVPGSTFFFHEITSRPGPMKITELRAEILTIQRLEDQAKEILMSELNWSEQFIDNLWESETVFTADEAVKYGLASRVLPNYIMPTPVFHYSDN